MWCCRLLTRVTEIACRNRGVIASSPEQNRTNQGRFYDHSSISVAISDAADRDVGGEEAAAALRRLMDGDQFIYTTICQALARRKLNRQLPDLPRSGRCRRPARAGRRPL